MDASGSKKKAGIGGFFKWLLSPFYKKSSKGEIADLEEPLPPPPQLFLDDGDGYAVPVVRDNPLYKEDGESISSEYDSIYEEGLSTDEEELSTDRSSFDDKVYAVPTVVSMVGADVRKVSGQERVVYEAPRDVLLQGEDDLEEPLPPLPVATDMPVYAKVDMERKRQGRVVVLDDGLSEETDDKVLGRGDFYTLEEPEPVIAPRVAQRQGAPRVESRVQATSAEEDLPPPPLVPRVPARTYLQSQEDSPPPLAPKATSIREEAIYDVPSGLPAANPAFDLFRTLQRSSMQGYKTHLPTYTPQKDQARSSDFPSNAVRHPEVQNLSGQVRVAAPKAGAKVPSGDRWQKMIETKCVNGVEHTHF